MSLEGHEVFISDYNAPKDFKEVWQKSIACSIDHSSSSIKIEKLFKFKA